MFVLLEPRALVVQRVEPRCQLRAHALRSLPARRPDSAFPEKSNLGGQRASRPGKWIHRPAPRFYQLNAIDGGECSDRECALAIIGLLFISSSACVSSLMASRERTDGGALGTSICPESFHRDAPTHLSRAIGVRCVSDV